MTGITHEKAGTAVLSVVASFSFAAAAFFGFGFPLACRAGGEEQDSMYEGKVNAPEFPEGLEWLNTDRPLYLKDLRGKVVLLDFWTYCCINCMHIIPDLKKLEAKYPNELVVIGVHSAKFTTEQESDNIRQAILRYEIEHPVVNDKDFLIWRAYGARAWPTTVLIDPAGKVVGVRSGEGIYGPFDYAISKVIEVFEAKGELDRTPLALKLEREKEADTLLRFPGKVLADESTNRLFIADSNHNRIVIVSLEDNSVIDVIGSGAVGLEDGDFEKTSFNHPQGMALAGDILYVADTENHAIRVVDLKERVVQTIAGTGIQASFGARGGAGKETALNSPWDLVLHDGILYIAMAGSHQLWRMDLETGYVQPHAGSGREDIIDSPLPEAALAQPSGITTDGNKLYFADSEVSAIRSADIDPTGKVTTIVGTGLFEFGDIDGNGEKVRLQHPLGVVFHAGLLYVADTYNNKIKIIDPKKRSSRTFLGSGKEGMADSRGSSATFDEPGGLSIAEGKIYIADTNNHLIRVADVNTGRVESLDIKNPETLIAGKAEPAEQEAVRLPAQSVKPGKVTLNISLELPFSYKLNDEAPTFIEATIGGREKHTFRNPDFPLSIDFSTIEDTEILLDYAIYYCREGAENLCYITEGRLLLPVLTSSDDVSDKINITLKTQ